MDAKKLFSNFYALNC